MPMRRGNPVRPILTGLIHVVRFLFSCEFIFVLFLFAGRYKASPSLQWVPVDLTAFFFGLSVAMGSLILLRRGFRVLRQSFNLVVIGLLFVVYVVTSMLWSPSSAYAQDKAFYIATLIFWPLIAAALIIGYDRKRLRRFLVALGVFAVWMSLDNLAAYTQAGGWTYFAGLGRQYVSIGRVIGLGVTLLLGYFLFFARGRWGKIAALGLGVVMVGLLLVAGGRSPLIATLAAGAVPLLVGWRFSSSGAFNLKRYVFPLRAVIGLGLATVGYLLMTGHLTTTLERLVQAVGSDPDSSTLARIGYYQASLSMWGESPLAGRGIGSWPVLMRFGDVQGYPHNIILEVLAELGLVGLLLFSALNGYALRTLGSRKLIRDDPLRMLVLMLYANALLNALASGDIPANRVLFAFLGLMTFLKGERAQHAHGGPSDFCPHAI